MRIFVGFSRSDDLELGINLADALVDAGHEVFAPPGSIPSLAGPVIATSIAPAIRRSDVVIALLTAMDPNVYYQLGLAVGANAPTLIASRRPEDIVVELSSLPYVHLTGDVDADAAAIIRRVAEIADERPRFDRSVRESAGLTLAKATGDPSLLEGASAMEFEQLVAKLFHERGFPIRTASTRPDRGFDLIIDSEPPTVVEVKHYSRRSRVSVGTVRQLLSSMTAAGAARAILVSSSGFTASAKAAAAEWPVELMTLEDLLRLPGPAPQSPIDPDAA